MHMRIRIAFSFVFCFLYIHYSWYNIGIATIRSAHCTVYITQFIYTCDTSFTFFPPNFYSSVSVYVFFTHAISIRIMSLSPFLVSYIRNAQRISQLKCKNKNNKQQILFSTVSLLFLLIFLLQLILLQLYAQKGCFK